jgi:regulation of enolase protein 1 (concanavalin A-like superfamily)
MQRGRFLHLAALAGVLALTAGARTPANAAAINTPAAPILSPDNGRVLVTFGGVLNATGYNVYRHEGGGAATLVNAAPTPYTWLIDDNNGAGLTNGTPLFYSVKAVVSGAEGPASAENVTTPAPPLFGALRLYNITTPGIAPAPGSVTLDTASDTVTIHASGDDIWDAQDGQSFLATPVSGDFTIAAQFLGAPTGGEPTYGKVGLEMRTGLEPLDEYALVFISVHRDPAILFEWRKLLDGTGNGGGGNGDAADDQKYPVWLRLSRQGTTMAAQQSQDGTTWTDVTDAQDFTRLPPQVYVGVAATAHMDKSFLDGKFKASSLSITTP